MASGSRRDRCDKSKGVDGFVTALDLAKIKKKRPVFGCSSLDEAIGPAIRPGHVIEVTGEAGAGKSQFLMNLCAGAPNDEDHHRCLVISTEGAYPAERLQQMVKANAAAGKSSKLAMDKILVDTVTDLDDLLECLTVKVGKTSKSFKLTLIVVDSIAAPLRSEDLSARDRANHVHKLGQALHQLASSLQVPVVVANQVTALIDQSVESYGHQKVVPCFGLAFTTYVHTRIFLERTDLVITGTNQRLRTATIDFCPLLPSGKPFHFIVNAQGVRAVQVNQ